ncbi:hypothetical protein Clacol_010470 [Clathrus columnatus]|uniref:Uncharacterized protein n=1 Tax=Clathrus columnatus TaxID=1419009 RepID=A0AAV5ATX4_9AGAM|nr:hypothetical protein Clacol_010470 [Clathrus columnatus]
MESNYYITGNPTYERQDIDEFRPLSKKYYHGRSFSLAESLASYDPVQFRVSFSEPRELIPMFNVYLEKSINLVEILLTTFNLCLNRTQITSFSNALRSARAVRNLTIISGHSLKDLCDLLSDRDLLPGLEKLNYSASIYENTCHCCYIIDSVLTLLKKRLEGSPLSLKIELGNFPRQELEQIEFLGLGVIQEEDKLEIIAYPKIMENISFKCTYGKASNDNMTSFYAKASYSI